MMMQRSALGTIPVCWRLSSAASNPGNPKPSAPTAPARSICRRLTAERANEGQPDTSRGMIVELRWRITERAIGNYPVPVYQYCQGIDKKEETGPGLFTAAPRL
jgi:hypothetical protein